MNNNNGYCDDLPDPDNSDVIKDTEEKVEELSQFLTIGPGIKGQENPFKVQEILGPGITVEDGKIKLVSDAVPIGFGFKTQQTFIYKQERNDNSQ